MLEAGAGLKQRAQIAGRSEEEEKGRRLGKRVQRANTKANSYLDGS